MLVGVGEKCGRDWGNFFPSELCLRPALLREHRASEPQSKGTAPRATGASKTAGLVPPEQLAGPWSPLIVPKSCLEGEREICPLPSWKVPCSRGESLCSTQSSGENLWGRDRRSHPQGSSPHEGLSGGPQGNSAQGDLLSGQGFQGEHFLCGKGSPYWEHSSEEKSSGEPVHWGRSPRGKLSSGGNFPSTCSLSVGSGGLSEPALFLLANSTGSDTIIYTLTENSVAHIHNNASPHRPRAIYGEICVLQEFQQVCKEHGKDCLRALLLVPQAVLCLWLVLECNIILYAVSTDARVKQAHRNRLGRKMLKSQKSFLNNKKQVQRKNLFLVENNSSRAFYKLSSVPFKVLAGSRIPLRWPN